MAVTKGTDSYQDENDLIAYAARLGLTISGDKTVLLYKAMDWLEIQSYLFSKYSDSQSLQFPRNQWYYDETENVVPDDVDKAQLVLCALIDSGENPNAIVKPGVIKEKIDIIEKEYSGTGKDGTNIYPEVSQLLKRYLSGGLTSFVVSRG